MIPVELWRLLHLLFSFSYVGSLVVAEWNGRAARATQDWRERAVLFEIIHRSSVAAGLGPLVLLGVAGNLLAARLGYSMGSGSWMRWANGLWLAAVLVLALVSLPGARRLAAISRLAAGGGPAEGYDRLLARWRIGNVAQSALFLGLLALMVFPWRG